MDWAGSRAAFKHIVEDGTLELAAVNDLVPAEELAYLLKHDSVYGRYGRDVRAQSGAASSSTTIHALRSTRRIWTSCPGATWPSTSSWSARACSLTKRTSSVTLRPAPSS